MAENLDAITVSENTDELTEQTAAAPEPEETREAAAEAEENVASEVGDAAEEAPEPVQEAEEIAASEAEEPVEEVEEIKEAAPKTADEEEAAEEAEEEVAEAEAIEIIEETVVIEELEEPDAEAEEDYFVSDAVSDQAAYKPEDDYFFSASSYDDEAEPVVAVVFPEDEEDDYYEEVEAIPVITLSAAQEASRSKRIADKRRSWIAVLILISLLAAGIIAIWQFMASHNIHLFHQYR